VCDPPTYLARTVAAALNPEAGTHSVTADPRELVAIERAGERSWTAWPYYARRYGERGRRFTRSDSAWIATLPDLPAESVMAHLRWLGSLLAARGMPRLLLEEHLAILHQELLVAVPERAEAYAVLAHGAEMLRRERERHLPNSTLALLETTFKRHLLPQTPDDLRAGMLIGAAVADEQAGVPRAVDSLLAWLADRARFPARWCRAIDLVLRQARNAPSNTGTPELGGAADW
jgi:hypothetical protein